MVAGGNDQNLTGDHRKSVTWTRSTRPAGHQRPVHRQPAVGAQRHSGLLLTRATTSPGVTGHDGRLRPIEGPSSVVDTTVAATLHIRVTDGSPTRTPRGRGQHPRKRPKRVGPNDHPLALAAQREAVVGAARGLACLSSRPSRRCGSRSRQRCKRRRRYLIAVELPESSRLGGDAKT